MLREALSDVIIIVGGTEAFPAHRVVLAAASPRLREILMTPTKGSTMIDHMGKKHQAR